MKVYEFQGRSVEKAIEQGLSELQKSKFDVDIKVLESGGLFKKAKVQIIVDEEESDLLSSMKEEIKNVFREEKKQAEENSKVEKSKDVLQENKKEVEPKEEIQQKVESESILNNQESENLKKEEQEKVAEENSKNSSKIHISDYEDGKDMHKEENELKKERAYESNKGSKEFLEGILKVLSIEGTVEIEEQVEHTKAVIKCDKAGALIGYKGDCMSAIQYIANIVEQKQNRFAKRLIVDIGDYRERRDDNLRELAERMANKVIKTKRYVKLDPMNAYDRRVIHTYLQTFNEVETYSEGEEPRRRLVIALKINN